jgi:hypothetical protein
MATLSAGQHKAWRLGTGITLLVLGLLVVGIGVAYARFDVYSAAIAGLNVITGAGMLVFHKL